MQRHAYCPWFKAIWYPACSCGHVSYVGLRLHSWILQASSEHSICFAVEPHAGAAAKQALEQEFEIEIQKKLIDGVTLMPGACANQLPFTAVQTLSNKETRKSETQPKTMEGVPSVSGNASANACGPNCIGIFLTSIHVANPLRIKFRTVS